MDLLKELKSIQIKLENCHTHKINTTISISIDTLIKNIIKYIICPKLIIKIIIPFAKSKLSNICSYIFKNLFNYVQSSCGEYEIILRHLLWYTFYLLFAKCVGICFILYTNFFPKKSLEILEENIDDIRKTSSNPKYHKFLEDYDLWKQTFINNNRLYQKLMKLFINEEENEDQCFNQMMRQAQKIINNSQDERVITFQENANLFVNTNRTKLLRECIIHPTFMYGIISIPINYSLQLIHKLLHRFPRKRTIDSYPYELTAFHFKPLNLKFRDACIIPIVGIVSYLLFSDTYPKYLLKETDAIIKLFEKFITHDQKLEKKISSLMRSYDMWKITHIEKHRPYRMIFDIFYGNYIDVNNRICYDRMMTKLQKIIGLLENSSYVSVVFSETPSTVPSAPSQYDVTISYPNLT